MTLRHPRAAAQALLEPCKLTITNRSGRHYLVVKQKNDWKGVDVASRKRLTLNTSVLTIAARFICLVMPTCGFGASTLCIATVAGCCMSKPAWSADLEVDINDCQTAVQTRPKINTAVGPRQSAICEVDVRETNRRNSTAHNRSGA